MSDKKKTIDGFAHWIGNEVNGVCHIPLNLCKKVLELLKEAQRKKGKWVCGRYCSECLWTNSNRNALIITTYNFCPRCGADMRGEQDENDCSR